MENYDTYIIGVILAIGMSVHSWIIVDHVTSEADRVISSCAPVVITVGEK